MTVYVRSALAILALLLMAAFAGSPAHAQEQPLSPMEKGCLQAYNSCRSPCFGKRHPGPCRASCQVTYNMCLKGKG